MSNEPHLEANLQRDIDFIRSKVRKIAELTESAFNSAVGRFTVQVNSLKKPVDANVGYKHFYLSFFIINATNHPLR